MLGIQNNNANPILMLPSDLIQEVEIELEYLSEKYHLIVQLKENTDDMSENKIILFSLIKKIGIFERFNYEIKMNYEDFKKLDGIFKLCETIEKIFKAISKIIDNKKIYINNITNENSVILSIEQIIPFIDDPITTNIVLLKKELKNEDLIEKLYTALKAKNNESKVKIESNQTVNVTVNTNDDNPLIIKPSENYDALKQVTVNVNVPQLKIESNKSMLINNSGNYIINPTDGNDAMKKVSINVDVPTHTIPVISKIQIYKKNIYNYTYSLSSFTKVTCDRTIPIPSNEILLYIHSHNAKYTVSEVINKGNNERNFYFKSVTTSTPFYYKIIDDKTITGNHYVNLKDNNDNIIQYIPIKTSFINHSSKLIRNGICNYRKYIDISLS